MVAIQIASLAPRRTLTRNGGGTPKYALLPGSNAIDSVPPGQCTFSSKSTNPLFTNGAMISIAQRGVFRPQGATYDIREFKLQQSPTSKDQCKNGGWMQFPIPRRLRNQGDCTQFVNSGK